MTIQVSPDGARYLQMADGHGAPMPFHLRWLAPKILGGKIHRWRMASWLGWIVFLLANGWELGWSAIILLAVLPGLSLSLRLPVLIDGMALGVTALAALDGPWWQQVGLALLAGTISERAPLFAALWAWSPWPLIGLLSPAFRYLFWRPGTEHPALVGSWAADVLHKSWRIAFQRDWRELDLLLPWGGFLIALWWMDMQMAVTLLFAYAQIAIATDTARLYQWAAPVLAAAICYNLDWRVCIIVAIVTWFNPWRGNGISTSALYEKWKA